jgi:hypothetical protein
MNAPTGTTTSKAAPAAKEPVFKTPYEKAFGLYIALTGLMVFFIPSDILTAHPWAVRFTDFMAGWVPQIDVITGLGVRPELNRFYYAVLWAMSPVFFVLCALMTWDGRRRTTPLWNRSLGKVLPLVLLGGFVLYASTHAYWMTDTGNGVLRFILGNRLGMAISGNIMYAAGPIMLAGGLMVFFAGWLSGAIPRHIRNQSVEVR